MEVRRSSSGKKLFTVDQKNQILGEFRGGISAPLLSKKYDTPVQNIYKWNRIYKEPKNSSREQELFDRLQLALAEIDQLKKLLGEFLIEEYMGRSRHRTAYATTNVGAPVRKRMGSAGLQN